MTRNKSLICAVLILSCNDTGQRDKMASDATSGDSCVRGDESYSISTLPFSVRVDMARATNDFSVPPGHCKEGYTSLPAGEGPDVVLQYLEGDTVLDLSVTSAYSTDLFLVTKSGFLAPSPDSCRAFGRGPEHIISNVTVHRGDIIVVDIPSADYPLVCGDTVTVLLRHHER